MGCKWRTSERRHGGRGECWVMLTKKRGVGTIGVFRKGILRKGVTRDVHVREVGAENCQRGLRSGVKSTKSTIILVTRVTVYTALPRCLSKVQWA